jgi:hypothetical protein
VSAPTRYLATRQAMLRRGLEDEVIELVKTPGTENPIDIGTKPLVGGALQGARSRVLGIYNESNQWGRADPEFEQLMAKQTEHCPAALAEVRRNGRKVTHWAWFVWPTSEGEESMDRPRIHTSNVGRLFARAPRSWREVLELICDLANASPTTRLVDIVPPADHHRIGRFCALFGGHSSSPRWMRDVCTSLASSLERSKAGASTRDS